MTVITSQRQPMLVALFLLAACGEATEPARVELPVVIDASGIEAVVTDLGYGVELTEVRVALEDLVFTVAGEAHAASLWKRVSDFFVGPAHAHPGHYQSGDVVGELRGSFVLDWLGDDGVEIGHATLLPGTYTAANFTFSRGSVDEGLENSDSLIGHTAILAGTATVGSESLEFTITVDSPEGRELVGAPFAVSIDEGSAGRLLLRFVTVDPLEQDTVFDGIDFAVLDDDNDGQVRIGPDVVEVEEAYNTFRRTFQTHDHFEVRYEQ